MNAVQALIHGRDPAAIAIAVVDVFLVATIIYRLLLLIRRTGAVYVLLGLLGISGMFFIAHEFSLTTLRWLLDHLINYLVLIVIIVFQTDIRRGLMRIGRRFFARISEEVSASLHEIVESLEYMAQNKTGALIVFERDMTLSELTQSGTPLDAEISRELLEIIFTPWPDNPLHDGAVLIRKNRILRAGVLLPLSSATEVGRTLGTRHRAAVGITEETDAVAVVVSEQRGSIGVAVGGQLVMGLTPKQLELRLRSLFAGETDTTKRASWSRRLMDSVGALFRDPKSAETAEG